ncbi:autotransporter outer membrane beta-barrel domain-containing protein [Pseudomonas aeruginosa]
MGSTTTRASDASPAPRPKATTTVRSWEPNVVGGYTLSPERAVLVEPRLAARYARVDIDGYHEKGSSAALKVDSQRYEVAELGAGVRVAGDFQVGNGNLQPQSQTDGLP